MKIRKYSEIKRLETFEQRYNYLRLFGKVGATTFGFDRFLNQILYRSKRWKETRDKIIIRDNACDLGIDGYDIYDRVLVHHINPLKVQDVELDHPDIYNPEYLICTNMNTHNAIHYGVKEYQIDLPRERSPNDTCPWL